MVKPTPPRRKIGEQEHHPTDRGETVEATHPKGGEDGSTTLRRLRFLPLGWWCVLRHLCLLVGDAAFLILFFGGWCFFRLPFWVVVLLLWWCCILPPHMGGAVFSLSPCGMVLSSLPLWVVLPLLPLLGGAASPFFPFYVFVHNQLIFYCFSKQNENIKKNNIY